MIVYLADNDFSTMIRSDVFTYSNFGELFWS